MSKTTIIVSCPIDTYSGYGARSRDLVKSLMKNPEYDVKVLSQRWGNTSFGYLDDHNETELSKSIIPRVQSAPDIWMQITVPNEFQKVGKYNIGITAGIETTVAPPQWIEGCNRMDLILTSSEHSKNVFKSLKFEQTDKSGRVLNIITLNTKIETLFEGLDVTKYFKTNSNFDLDSIKESFCFLFVGHWLQGSFGQDRKNVGYTIKSFLETFKNKPAPPALILKTGLGTSSHVNTDIILKKINEIRSTVKGKLPNIYLVDGDMEDSDINALYNHPKIKAMVCLTKGEGFGRPLLEFSITGKPIIASGWSGQIDFLNKEFTTLINGELTQVDNSAVVKDMILKEGKWFTPNDGEVGKAYKNIYSDYKKYLQLGKRQAHYSKSNFSLENMEQRLQSILDENLPIFPKQTELALPNLTLPKLKLK